MPNNRPSRCKGAALVGGSARWHAMRAQHVFKNTALPQQLHSMPLLKSSIRLYQTAETCTDRNPLSHQVHVGRQSGQAVCCGTRFPGIAPRLVIRSIRKGRPRRARRAGRRWGRAGRRRRGRRRRGRAGRRWRAGRQRRTGHVCGPVAGLDLVVEEQPGLAGLVVGHVWLHTPCRCAWAGGTWLMVKRTAWVCT